MKVINRKLTIIAAGAALLLVAGIATSFATDFGGSGWTADATGATTSRSYSVSDATVTYIPPVPELPVAALAPIGLGVLAAVKKRFYA